jgi:2-keto-4-pentenoate hydratase/2-oxohepta-3-ene-1,7-dioic acid hydratase in catechol pathway
MFLFKEITDSDALGGIVTFGKCTWLGGNFKNGDYFDEIELKFQENQIVLTKYVNNKKVYDKIHFYTLTMDISLRPFQFRTVHMPCPTI